VVVLVMSAASALLDGCATVFLDIGSNAGTQLQHVFQPELRPGASIQSYYDEFLGKGAQRARDRGLCAIAMEASPTTEAHLVALRDSYIGRGLRVALFLRTAVGVRNGTADLSFVPPSNAHQSTRSLGAMPTGPRARHVAVSVVDLGQFIRQHVISRKLPAGAVSRVVMHLDIEGCEHSLLPRLMEAGVLCELDFLYLELHAAFEGKSRMKQYQQSGEALVATVREQLVRESCRMFLVDSWQYARRPPRYSLGTVGSGSARF